MRRPVATEGKLSVDNISCTRPQINQVEVNIHLSPFYPNSSINKHGDIHINNSLYIYMYT